MGLGMSGASFIRDGSKSSSGIHGTRCVRCSYAMISGLVAQHKGHSGLLPLAADVPREFQAAYYFKII